MGYDKAIIERLQKLIDGGMTQKEIADKTGITQSHVSKLLNSNDKNNSAKAVTITTFFKLFPEMESLLDKNLNGFSHLHYMQQTGNEQIQQINSPNANAHINTTSINDFKQAIISVILDDTEICDKCKVRVLRILNKTKQ